MHKRFFCHDSSGNVRGSVHSRIGGISIVGFISSASSSSSSSCKNNIAAPVAVAASTFEYFDSVIIVIS
jgi:hypothetical protein